MAHKTYSIFGAGAAGLYTAWRLLGGTVGAEFTSRQLAEGDVLELYDWGKYAFSKQNPGTREPGARVCTWHYQDDKTKSYLELGGMRYSEWNRDVPHYDDTTAGGHRVVTTVISQLGLDKYSVPFNESTNPLFYLRTKNMFLNDFSSSRPAPYNVDRYGAATQPDIGFNVIEQIAVTNTTGPQTRPEWDAFYQHGRIAANLSTSSVFQKGDLLKNVGYWNLMYDRLGSEGFGYTADGNGYTSNVINWNSAVAIEANNEFTPGTQYKTLTIGYSGMFTALFEAIAALAQQKGVGFRYFPDTRLQSIFQDTDGTIHFGCATRDEPHKAAQSRTTDAAWLAMPRHALELVARGTRFVHTGGLDVLNGRDVKLYLEAAIMQPSYKIGMFFDTPWWTSATYAPQLTGYVITDAVIAALKKEKFPSRYLDALAKLNVPENAYGAASDLVAALEAIAEDRLTVREEQQLLAAALRSTIGPSVTDTPVRQVVYFGNNALDTSAEPIYGMLASYDDESYTDFWQGLELNPDEERKVPLADDIQPLIGPRKVPDRMLKMLRRQLAEIHFGPNANFDAVPEPKEARYMDWSLPPFNAGYHAWASHYDIADVQQKIRKPSQLIPGADADIFIVGEAYSNDQAWVEGAYCTAESVLNDFFGVEPIIDDTNYPFICRVVP
ncbi:MAG TPA: hypothetical protein VHS78_16790 [Candidatus Elarobacter sp.]|jgi:hypothetical protein|nr:hypothetical protein [Candidatus Elarobacter sp.]